MVEHVVALITAPSKEVGRDVGRALLEQGLAACVNLVPAIESLYAWEGELCNDEEVLLVIKTTAAVLRELMRTVQDIHPYDVPEIIALPIAAGSPDYLNWISDVVDDE